MGETMGENSDEKKIRERLSKIIELVQLSTVGLSKHRYYLEFTRLGKMLVDNGFIPGEDDLRLMAMSKTRIVDRLGVSTEYSLLDIYIILTSFAIMNDLSFVVNNIQDPELADALKDIVYTITKSKKRYDELIPKWKVYRWKDIVNEKENSKAIEMTNAHLRAINGLIYSYIYYRINTFRKYALIVKGRTPYTKKDVKLFDKIMESLGRLNAIEHEQRVIDSLLNALEMLGYNKPVYMKVFDEIYRETGGKQLGFRLVSELDKRGVRYHEKDIGRLIVSYEIYRILREIRSNNKVYEDVEKIVSEIHDVIGTVTGVDFDYERIHRLQPLQRKRVLISIDN